LGSLEPAEGRADDSGGFRGSGGTRMWRNTAILAALLALVALGGRRAEAQTQPTIKIVSPAAGATVTGPVTLQVMITGATVKPAAEGDPQAFHYHALVDVDRATVVQAGQPIPTGQASIIHTADASLALPNLAPGQHTVTVILTRTDHVPLNPTIEDKVTFTVAAPQAAQPAAQATPAPAAQATPAPGAATVPRTGHGGELLTDPRPSWLLLLTLAAVIGGGMV